jgi:hypothetical protein
MELLDSEPVLTRVGPVVGAIVVYLVAKGLIDQDTANLFVGLAVAVVGSGAAFGARALVTPWPPKPEPQKPESDSDPVDDRHV